MQHFKRKPPEFRFCRGPTANGCVHLQVPAQVKHSSKTKSFISQLRLVQSRSACGAFYVKDVTPETLKRVATATGLEDLQVHPDLSILFLIFILAHHHQQKQLQYTQYRNKKPVDSPSEHDFTKGWNGT